MRNAGKWLKWVGATVVVVFLSVAGVWARDLTAAEILTRMVAKNAERQAALERWTSERTYSMEYKGIGGAKSAAMVVHAEYTSAEGKRFTVVSESGSKMICEKVLRKLVESEEEQAQKANRMQSSLSAENYDAEVLGQEEMAGAKAWVLAVKPKVASKFTYRGRVWVSQEDYALVRVLGEPAKNPSWWVSRASIDSRFARTGIFWLPAVNASVSHVRIGGDARLTIDYGEYHVQAKHGDAQVAQAGGPKVDAMK